MDDFNEGKQEPGAHYPSTVRGRSGLNRGSVLIEVLLAVVVMSIGLTLIIGSYLSAYRATVMQANQMRALLLLENHLTLLTRRGVCPAKLNNGGTYDSPDQRFHYRLDQTRSMNGLIGLRLTVSWPSGRNERAVSAATWLLEATE